LQSGPVVIQQHRPSSSTISEKSGSRQRPGEGTDQWGIVGPDKKVYDCDDDVVVYYDMDDDDCHYSVVQDDWH
jgi:hypothetical protein